MKNEEKKVTFLDEHPEAQRNERKSRSISVMDICIFMIILCILYNLINAFLP